MRSRKLIAYAKSQLFRLGVTGLATTLTVMGAAGISARAAQAATLTPVTFQLNWYPGGYHAGFYVALQQGYYKAEGLSVNIVPGNGSTTAAQLVATGQVAMGYADADPAMELIAKGAKMRAVATIYQSNPDAVEALSGSGITSVADLKGKTVGLPPGSQDAMMPLLLGANGLTMSQVHLVHVATDALIPFLLEHKVDAILGSVDFYNVTMSERGVKYVSLPFATNGVPTVSDSIIVTDRFLQAHPSIVRRFVAASLRGWNYAFHHPAVAVADIEKSAPGQAQSSRSVYLQLQATASLVCTDGAKFVGKATPQAWANSQKLLSSVGLLPKGVNPVKYYTYQYLPAQAEMEPCPVHLP